MRRRLVALLLTALILTILVMPAASAQPVNLLEVGSYEADIDASGSATFQWVVYNNDNSSCLIRIDPHR